MCQKKEKIFPFTTKRLFFLKKPPITNSPLKKSVNGEKKNKMKTPGCPRDTSSKNSLDSVVGMFECFARKEEGQRGWRMDPNGRERKREADSEQGQTNPRSSSCRVIILALK